MTIKAEFLQSCIVSGDPVHAGEVRELRPDIFNQLKGMRYVQEAAAPAPVAGTPAEQPQKEPAKKKKGQ